MFVKIIDRFRKRKIFKLAEICGRDRDGDVITYKGVTYFIHILSNRMERVPDTVGQNIKVS